VELLSISTDKEFRSKFAGTALTRAKRRGLLRNGAVVAANLDCTAAVPALKERIEHDPEPLIRSHALWALARLAPQLGSALAESVMISDPDPMVLREAERIRVQ
jgi:epoxyqueuosine reductase